MTHYRMDYEEIIRSAGHRVTPQRLLILDAVCDENGHTTLGQVFARVRQVDPTIDRSTLYRTLKLFVDLGLLVSANTGDGETYYEITKKQHHHHLVCRHCGRQQEIEHPVIQNMFAHLEEAYQFKADTDHLVLFGLCHACANNDSSLHRATD